MADPITEIKDHYEELSCQHQNNLLLIYPDGHMNEKGVCPKGCKDVQVSRTKRNEFIK